MIDIEKYARDGFKLVNGEICSLYGSTLEYGVRVYSFGWGSPCTEYRFSNYDLHAYSIVKQYDGWYLMKDGYTKICQLRHLGGENWETY